MNIDCTIYGEKVIVNLIREQEIICHLAFVKYQLALSKSWDQVIFLWLDIRFSLKWWCEYEKKLSDRLRKQGWFIHPQFTHLNSTVTQFT